MRGAAVAAAGGVTVAAALVSLAVSAVATA